MMRRSARGVPKRLGEKLKQIRLNLGIDTFEEMIRRLDCPDMRLYPSASIFLRSTSASQTS